MRFERADEVRDLGRELTVRNFTAAICRVGDQPAVRLWQVVVFTASTIGAVRKQIYL